MSLSDQSAATPFAHGPKVAACAFAAVCSGWTGQATAEPVAIAAPAFPATAAAHDVLPWLAGHTSVRAGDIVVISPQAVVSLDRVAHGSDRTAPIVATVREELIDAALAERLHARSTRVDVELDCAAGVFRIRENTRFPLPDLKGDPVQRTPSADWTRLEDGTVMFSVAHAACGTGGPGSGAQLTSVTAPASAPMAVSPVPAAARNETPRAPPPASPSATASAAKASAPGASFRVQLGSYSSAANAHVAVAELTRGHPGPIKGRDVVVHKMSVKGRDYFFVAVEGFAQRADASGFCKSVHAAPDACLIRH